MKVELELPDPKFQVGDFVELDRDSEKQGFLMVGQVQNVLFRGG